MDKKHRDILVVLILWVFVRGSCLRFFLLGENMEHLISEEELIEQLKPNCETISKNAAGLFIKPKSSLVPGRLVAMLKKLEKLGATYSPSTNTFLLPKIEEAKKTVTVEKDLVEEAFLKLRNYFKGVKTPFSEIESTVAFLMKQGFSRVAIAERAEAAVSTIYKFSPAKNSGAKKTDSEF